MYFERDTEVGNVTITKGGRMWQNIQMIHAKLGHLSVHHARKVAKQLGWEISRGSLGVCEPCTIGKANKKF